jgi:tetratricopeptide (TPR) repeat protein
VTVVWVVEDEWGFRRALRSGDVTRAEQAVRRLALVGHDNAEYRYALGRQRAEAGHVLAARAHVDRSLTLQPSGNAWMLSGRLHEAEKQWSAAAEAYDRSIELGAPNPRVYFRAGVVALELGDAERARAFLERAAETTPGNPAVLRALREAGRPAPAGSLRPPGA